MAWPSTPVATAELITASQLNGLPVLIANTTLTGDVASIDLSSIPGHYAHLLLVVYARGSVAATTVPVKIRFNGDSGSNYDQQYLLANAATPGAGEAFAGTSAQIGNATGSSAGANLFGAMTALIPHYANNANNKVSIAEWGNKHGTATGNLEVGSLAGFWRSNSAITQITILPNSGNLVSGSRVTLYGLPG